MGASRVREWLRSSDESADSIPGPVLHALLVLAVLRLWLMRLPASFWLDETYSYYLVGASWGDMFAQLDGHPQLSRLYFVLLNAWHDLGFPGEAGLRLPSLAAMGIAAFLLFRISLRFLDRETAYAASIIFICFPEVAREAANARPYAAGMMCWTAAVWGLLRWFEGKRIQHGLISVSFAALSVWFHYTFATILLVLAVYALWRGRRDAPVSRLALGGAAAAVCVFLSPLAADVVSTWRTAHLYDFEGTPYLLDLSEALALIPASAGLLLGILAAFFLGRPGVRRVETSEGFLPLVVAWAGIPLLGLFAAAKLGQTGVFVPRYYLPMFGGAAMLIAWGIRFLSPAWFRTVVLVVAVGVSILSIGGMRNPWLSREDWRGAAEAVRSFELAPDTPVLLSSGYVETKDNRFLRSSAYRAYLTSPLLVYPVPGRLIPLPYAFSSDAEKYLESVIKENVLGHRRVVLVSRDENAITAWLLGRLKGHGFQSSSFRTYKTVAVFLLERSSGASHASP